jgi:plasmid stabilization system protein ParE
VKKKAVIRTQSYQEDLDAIEAYTAQDNPRAAADLWLDIDEQVDALADPKFPRRPGRVAGTAELVAHPNYKLVAHPNYIVILEEDATTVTVLNVVHARRHYP